jgi:hypothetical protein
MSGPDVPEPRLLWARHLVVNTLVRYLRAVDDHDLGGVLAELSHATVDFGGSPLKGMEALAETYRAAFAAGGRTRHLLHEVEVAEHGAGVVGRAAYQRWALETDPPQISALGGYRAGFAVDGDRWRLVELAVHRDWQRT